MSPPTGAARQEPDRTLWVLTEVYYPEEISTGYYLTTLAEGLARTGTVKVISGQPKHMSRGLRAPRREMRNGVEITRARGTTLDKNFFPFRLINMFTIGVSVFVHSLFRFRRRDHVLVCTAPPSLPVTTTLAALIKGTTMTLLVQDSYPEILVAVGAARENSLFVRVVNFFNRWVYKYATNIVVMGRDMSDLFRRKTAGLDAKIVTIPNWADLDTINPAAKSANALLHELGIADKFVLLYAGNIGPPTDVETIIEAATTISDREVHFLFIGAGAKRKWLLREVAERGLTNVTVLDYRPRAEQNVFLNACDVGLIALIEGMKGTAMPSRTYNIMAAGKPILAITETGSELAMVIDEEAVGECVRPGDASALLAAISRMKASPQKLEEMGDRARKAAVNKYSAEAAIEKYRDAVTFPG